MKLRIKGNSLRLRLQRSEIAALQETGEVADQITFGPAAHQTLRYMIEVGEGDTIEVIYVPATLRVRMPRTDVETWATTDRVGFEATLENGTDDPLSVLLEKDFKCLVDRPGEDETDAYENPAGPGHC
jgi:hypothetical protein